MTYLIIIVILVSILNELYYYKTAGMKRDNYLKNNKQPNKHKVFYGDDGSVSMIPGRDDFKRISKSVWYNKIKNINKKGQPKQ